MRRARRLIRFLTQPFAATAAQFTGGTLAGVGVTLEDTLSGCRAILDGEADDWGREFVSYMVGTLDEERPRLLEARPKGKT